MSVDWLLTWEHLASLSLLAIGGVITTAPDMQRFLVREHGWLTADEFNNAIALAQAAPGPNVLFVALIGWQVGLNSRAQEPSVHAMPWEALLGAFVSMSAVLLPSSILAYFVRQWVHRNRELVAVRAFTHGMAPIVVAMLVAAAWILVSESPAATDLPPRLLAASLVALLAWRTRIHQLWFLLCGAGLGVLEFL